MTSQGVFVRVKTENQAYLCKEWSNAMETLHGHLTLLYSIVQK